MRRVWAWVGVAVCTLGLTGGATADTPSSGKSWWPFGKSDAPQPTSPFQQPVVPYHLSGTTGMAPKPAEPSMWDKMTGYVGGWFKPKPQPEPHPITLPNTSQYRIR